MNNLVKILESKSCECGCGREVVGKNRFIHGHSRRGKHTHHSEETRIKIGQMARGRKASEETRMKMSMSGKGKNKGFKHSNEMRKKLSEANKGKHLSEETKKKISISMKGRKISDETKLKISDFRKGKPSPTKGKTWPIASRIKFSISQRGSNGNNWRGGIENKHRAIRGRIEFSLWRESVYVRDNWTCQKCLIKGGKLHPHHIRNFAEYEELRFAIDNGITFCRKHHADFHKIYGFKNNNQDQISDYIKKKNPDGPDGLPLEN